MASLFWTLGASAERRASDLVAPLSASSQEYHKRYPDLVIERPEDALAPTVGACLCLRVPRHRAARLTACVCVRASAVWCRCRRAVLGRGGVRPLLGPAQLLQHLHEPRGGARRAPARPGRRLGELGRAALPLVPVVVPHVWRLAHRQGPPLQTVRACPHAPAPSVPALRCAYALLATWQIPAGAPRLLAVLLSPHAAPV